MSETMAWHQTTDPALADAVVGVLLLPVKNAHKRNIREA